MQTQPGRENKHLLSLSPRVLGSLKVFAKFGVSQCSQIFALHVAIALLLAIAVMIRSSRDVHDQRRQPSAFDFRLCVRAPGP